MKFIAAPMMFSMMWPFLLLLLLQCGLCSWKPARTRQVGDDMNFLKHIPIQYGTGPCAQLGEQAKPSMGAAECTEKAEFCCLQPRLLTFRSMCSTTTKRLEE